MAMVRERLHTLLYETEHSLGKEWGETGPCLLGFSTLENSEMLHEAAFQSHRALQTPKTPRRYFQLRAE